MNDIRFQENLEFKIENVGYVSVQRNKNYFFEYKKGKETYSIIYVAEGQLSYTLTGSKETYLINKGDTIFIPKHLPYKTMYLEDNTLIQIIVFDITGDILPSCLQNTICTKSRSMRAVFSEITNDPLLLASKAYELLYHIIRKADKGIPVKYKKILPAIEHITKNYTENHKINYYAQLCNMSESNFRKLFGEYTGKSPIEYRNDIRMGAVHTMILSGEFTIQEAAYKAGFNNMSFFYQLYHKSDYFNDR